MHLPRIEREEAERAADPVTRLAEMFAHGRRG